MREGKSYGCELKEKAAFVRAATLPEKGFFKQSVPLKGNILLGGGGGGGSVEGGDKSPKTRAAALDSSQLPLCRCRPGCFFHSAGRGILCEKCSAVQV